MKFWNRYKQSNEEKNLFGYYFINPAGNFDTGRGTICLMKAVLMFCASLGTIGSIVSAFGMNVNFPLIFVFLLAASLILAFLHYRRLLFNLCYPLIFVIFTFSILRHRDYANSGYQAILNLVKEEYRFYFGLNYSGEAYEVIDDRYTSITIVLIYLGFFLLVLLNIAISNYMSVFLTMLFTFPFLQFGIYIGKFPSFLFILLLVFCYTSIAFLKRSGHYTLSENRKKDTPFLIKKDVFSYKGHGRTMGQLVMISFVISFVFSLVTYPLMALTLPGAGETSSLKAVTDSYIQTIVQSGFSSLFNRYEASGGISSGRLGGVGRIRADYETDMEVTFVPTSTEVVYLKAYTGVSYTSQQWLAFDDSDGDLKEVQPVSSPEAYEDFTAHLEANRLALFGEENDENGQRGKMVINNIDADSDYLYLPYYTAADSDISYSVNHSILYGNALAEQPYTLYYYPYTQDFSGILDKGYDQLLSSEDTDTAEKSYIQSYEKYCKSHYTDVPAEVQPALEEAMDEIGEGENAFETVERIQNYFAQQFQYSVSPGTTPRDQDFASYFLQVQKKGYCAHFATAGTLLCRAYGIPARYVEGYVIQVTDLADAEIEEEDTADWLWGTSDLTQTGVVTVSIPDANAHAWTEIYIEGFGWIPVDFTTAAEGVDEEEEYDSFLSMFTGLFSLEPGTDTVEYNADTGNVSALFTDNLYFLLPVGILLLLLVMAPFLWKLIRILRRHKGRAAAYKEGRFDVVLPYYYQKIIRTLEKKERMPLNPCLLPQEAFDMLKDLLPDMSEDSQRAAKILEEGIYGREQVTREEADFFIQYAKEILLSLKKSKSLL